MAQDIEANLAEAMESVVEETIAETDELELEQETEDEVVDESTPEDGDDDAEAEEAAPDEEAEAEVAEGEEEAAEPEEWAWDGNIDSIEDPKLREYVRHIDQTTRSGVKQWQGKIASQWGVQKQAFERRIKELEAAEQARAEAALEPPVPEMPGENATAEEWNQYHMSLGKRGAWEQHQQMREQGLLPRQAPQASVDSDEAFSGRIQALAQKEGYTQEIDMALGQRLTENPDDLHAARTDPLALERFFNEELKNVEIAKLREELKQRENAEIQRRAKARSRATPKPKPSKKAKSAPAKKYAESINLGNELEEVVGDIVKESFSEYGI